MGRGDAMRKSRAAQFVDSRRLFTVRQVRQLLIAADGKCQRCGVDLTDQPFEAHHIRRHADGGQTQLYNGMVLCIPCHKGLT
jgi:5-methylcytosine-specific restriction endonuclease McrA